MVSDRFEWQFLVPTTCDVDHVRATWWAATKNEFGAIPNTCPQPCKSMQHSIIGVNCVLTAYRNRLNKVCRGGSGDSMVGEKMVAADLGLGPGRLMRGVS